MGRLLDEDDVIAEIERHKNYVGEKYRQKHGDADGTLDLYFKAHDHVIEAIKMKVPSAQPEIIHCRDCAKSESDSLFQDIWCDGKKVTAEYHCGYAECMQKGGKNGERGNILQRL